MLVLSKTMANNMPQLKNQVINRPKCRLKGCDTRTSEGGFCDGHWTEYRLSAYWAGDRRDAFVSAKNKEVTGCSSLAKRRQKQKTKPKTKHKTIRLCRVEGCVTQALARGLCSFHYERWRRHGRPNMETWVDCGQAKEGRNPRRSSPQRGCKIEGCSEDHYAYGLCHGHYSRWKHKRVAMAEWITSASALKPIVKRKPKLVATDWELAD